MKRVIDQCMCGEDEQPLHLRNWSIVYFDGHPLPGVTQVVRCHSCGSQWKTRDMDAHDLSAMRKVAYEGQSNFECSDDFKRVREQSILLLQEASYRLKWPRNNANGGPIQLGGVYWRLMDIAASIEPFLCEFEGNKHAARLINRYGYKTGKKPLGRISVRDLALSVPTSNLLIHANIYYVSDLLSKTSNELLRIPEIGRKRIQEIEAALADHGLELSKSKDDREALDAYARLINAAPDLLEALQEFVRNPGGDYTEVNAIAAIEKAIGKSSTPVNDSVKLHRAGSFGGAE